VLSFYIHIYTAQDQQMMEEVVMLMVVVVVLVLVVAEAREMGRRE
jgi:DMSO/TMAO reductase YedYZ heme-binding membrane subunit